MFSLHQRGNSRAAEAYTDLHPEHLPEHLAGPLGGELADLYMAALIMLPLALLLKSFLF